MSKYKYYTLKLQEKKNKWKKSQVIQLKENKTNRKHWEANKIKRQKYRERDKE